MSQACRQAWIAAYRRAVGEQLIPYPNQPGWPVLSWSVKIYTVSVTGPRWCDLACTCRAGQSGHICKHAAVVAKAVSCRVRPVRGTARVTEAPAYSARRRADATVQEQATAIAQIDPRPAMALSERAELARLEAEADYYDQLSREQTAEAATVEAWLDRVTVDELQATIAPNTVTPFTSADPLYAAFS